MSWLILNWSMIASSCLTLAVIHVVVWFQERAKREYLLFSVMAVATAIVAFIELKMMGARTPSDYSSALRWIHLPGWVIILSLLGFVKVHLRAGRPWLAWAVVGLRTLSLAINFLSPININFLEMTELRHIPFLGANIAIPVGVPNPWMLVAQSSLVLLVVFIVDAAITVWRRGERFQACLVGGSIVIFAVLSTIQLIAVLWQHIDAPITASLFFMGINFAMAFELSLVAVNANKLAIETQESRAKISHLGKIAMIGEMSASLAHEINQPLGIILSNAQAAQRLLGREPLDVKEIGDILDDIVKEDLRASDVIKRIRALLKRGEVNLQRLDLNDIVLEVTRLTRNDLASRNVVLSLDLSESLPRVMGDRIELQQVLINLLINACESMENVLFDGRRIRVATRCDGSGLHVSVEDSGSGLSADVDQLFQPFYTTKNHGLGMGLAICRTIMTAHHGRIWAKANQGVGSTFTICLPYIEDTV